MSNVHTLIDIDEGMDAMLKFIGSEEFYKLSENLSTPINGFMFGLSYGLILASVKSTKFSYAKADNTGEDGEQE